MAAAPSPPLLVDRYLDGLIRANVVGAALDIGLVDALLTSGAATVVALARTLAVDPKELDILVSLLAQHDVLEIEEGSTRLTPTFRRALECRDLLEVRVDYLRRVTRAMATHYGDAVRDPRRFLGALIDFFVFDARPDFDAALIEASRPWVRYMSTLTRYHVPHLLDRYDFSIARRWLDVAGNNGEQALQICRRHPEVSVTVVDTPVVSALGVEHVRQSARARGDASALEGRIAFAPADLASAALPTGYDAVIAKSVLHDWSDDGARRILDAITRALPSGAPLVVFEFARYDLTKEPLRDTDVVNLPFLSHLRDPEWYVAELTRRGYREVMVRRVDEIHFMLVEARRGDGS